MFVESLKLHVTKSIKWLFLSMFYKFIVGLIQIFIITRFLTPGSLGVYFICLSVIGFFSLFSEAGVAGYVIQKENITEEEKSAAFWFSLTLSITFVAMNLAFSLFISDRIFSDSRIGFTLALLSPLILFNTLATIFRSYSEKKLKFKTVSILEVTTSSISILLTTILLIAGLELLAISFSLLFSALLNVIFSWILLSEKWKPKLGTFKYQTVELIRYSLLFSSNSLIGNLNSIIDTVIGGKLLGVTKIGYYAVAKNLVWQVHSFFGPTLSRVIFPAISIVQRDTKKVSAIFLKQLRITSFLISPVIITIVINAELLVQVLFGPGWEQAIPVLKILCFFIWFRSVSSTVGSLTLFSRNLKTANKINLATFLLNVTLIILIGSKSESWLAWVLVLVSFNSYFIFWYWLCFKPYNISLRSYLDNSLIFLLMVCMLQIPAFIAVLRESGNASEFKVLIISLIGNIFYIIFTFYYDRKFVSELVHSLLHNNAAKLNI